MRYFCTLLLIIPGAASAVGFVGKPGDLTTTKFCQVYKCILEKRQSNALGGGYTFTYQLTQLPRIRINVETQTDNDIVYADLTLKNIYYKNVNINELKAIRTLLETSTGEQVNFSLNECRPSGDPYRAQAPLLVSDAEGHTYQIRCASLRAQDVNAQELPPGFKPLTFTGISVQPKY